MGRPPIGKVAMTGAERTRLYRLKHAAAKPVTKPVTKQAGAAAVALAQKLARAEARIEELEAKLAGERKRREATSPPTAHNDATAESALAGVGQLNKQTFKLLCRLDSSNENEVLTTARALVSNLKANGSDLRTLADGLETEWKKQQKAKPAPPPPIDWPEVEAAITRYAADRTAVRFNAVWKAAKAAVPALDKYRLEDAIPRHIMSCLRRLGFTRSSSGRTWRRT